MRVTNLMMTNNALYNLQKQEQRLNKLDQQYTTQKKISTPSEDPIVASKALKLNTTYSEVSQYVGKNIPDAEAWMSMTQSAIDNVSSILSNIYEKCVQGNTDALEDSDRAAIATALSEMKEQIYQEGTSSYSGRFLFTGFKTDTNLIFTDKDEDVKYDITENFNADNISVKSTVINQIGADESTAGKVPARVELNRVQLAYDNVDDDANVAIVYTNKGDDTEQNLAVTKKYATYNEFIADYEQNGINEKDVVYIADQGELILGDTAKDTLFNAESFQISYSKTGFDQNDLRPEHYFECTKTVLSTGKTTEYKNTDQQIRYLVNYNQQMTVNVQAKDSFTHDMGRNIDELVEIVNAVTAAKENKKAYEEKMNASIEGSDAYNEYKKLYEAATVEYELKNKIMQEAFAENETRFQQYGIKFSNQGTDVGTRQQRLDLIKSRLTQQKADVEELQSSNIDVDLTEIIIRYTSAYDVYQAALSATSKSITQTLLDYL